MTNNFARSQFLVRMLFLVNSMRKGRLIAFAILLSALFLQYSDPVFLQNFRHRLFDIYQQYLPKKNISSRQVMVVDIDERSLLELGQWPWPRNQLAQMIDNLNTMGARVIGFDMIFGEDDRLSPGNIVNTIPNLPANVIADLKSRQSFDSVFSQAIERSKVVLGIAVSEKADGANNYGYTSTANFIKIGEDPTPYLRNYPAVVGNIAILDDAAHGRGMISLDQDFDGIVRQIPLANRVGDKLLPSITLDMLRVANDHNVAIRTGEFGIEEFIIAGSTIPTDFRGRVWINYSPYDPARYISASDVISNSVDPAIIKDRYILVGTSAAGLKDLRSSPLTAALPGVEMHVQLLENVLAKSFLIRSEIYSVLEWGGTFFISLGLIILVPIVGARFTLGLLVIATGLAVASTIYLFSHQAILVDFTYSLAVTIGIYIILVYASYLSSEQERTRIRSAFSQYLSPDLVKRLTASPENLVLGGEEREMTFLFCDVRDFTGISETYKNDPQGLTTLINDFLTPMTDQILRHQGTIDKYMGDNIMAFWNAPLENPNHAKDAVDAALTMVEELKEVNQTVGAKAKTEGLSLPTLRIGIGLNTGTCIVGNLGSQQRFDYSVLGDSVNLASRLEGLNKTYGLSIIVGEDTVSAVDGYAFLELDKIAVKGRTAATQIYAVMGDQETRASDHFQRCFNKTQQMLDGYRSQNWAATVEFANSLKKLEPTLTKIADLYVNRVEKFKESPPPEDWDGVFRATSK